MSDSGQDLLGGLDAEELELLQSAADSVAIADTPNPAEYHDPSNVKLALSSGTMGSRMGGGPGQLGATMIPRATRLGGSQGFDPHQPCEVNVIDLTTKKQTTIDLSQLSREEFAAACDPNLCNDFGTVAAVAFHRLAKKQQKEQTNYEEDKTGQGVLSPKLVTSELREPPVGGFGTAYVVPKSTKGGSQVVQTRSSKPRGFRKIGEPTVPVRKPPGQSTMPFPQVPAEARRMQQLQEVTAKKAVFQKSIQPAPEQSPFEEQDATIQHPQYEVHFEIPGVYEMTSQYHEVILEDNFLVLVYDNNCSGARFRPQPSTAPIFVNVAGDDRVFRCLVPGIQYTSGRTPHDAGREHVVLLIDEEISDYSGEPI